MRRGFKARAERHAADARKKLGLSHVAPLDAGIYATHLGVLIIDFAELELTAGSRRQLLEIDSQSWSAMAIRDGSTYAIVVNVAQVTRVEGCHVPPFLVIARRQCRAQRLYASFCASCTFW